MRSILVISPIPSHPQFQGNSARIYRLTRMYQLAGYQVHFVYFGMEGMDEQQQRNMSSCWDHFYFVQPVGPAAEPSYGEYFDIDDWYDKRVSELVETLCDTYQFDICLTNYVWFSKVLDSVSAQTLKIIDTHDVFGDRHLVAKQAGLEPVWFYTTRALESLALSRADLIIAIQDEEQAYFESITDTPVTTLGYVVPLQRILPRNPITSSKIRVGYIGSGNPFNVSSMLSFQANIMAHPELLDKFEFVLAGTICRNIESENQVFTIVGMVDELDDFYSTIDIAVNPMVGGTGLKIKTLEALSFGKPLLGTVDAMVGIPSENPLHQCANVEELVTQLTTFSEQDLAKLTIDSQQVFEQYNLTHIKRFNELFNKVAE
ncbi:glycosyltransferase [Aliiglaciecola litoralis]|uniref:Uncharacterized protein n=1 Tax=Aliiglaciecola litoralis TaxID=582857 RepID=A0ABN1LJK0_9ALTE